MPAESANDVTVQYLLALSAVVVEWQEGFWFESRWLIDQASNEKKLGAALIFEKKVQKHYVASGIGLMLEPSTNWIVAHDVSKLNLHKKD